MTWISKDNSSTILETDLERMMETVSRMTLEERAAGADAARQLWRYLPDSDPNRPPWFGETPVDRLSAVNDLIDRHLMSLSLIPCEHVRIPLIFWIVLLHEPVLAEKLLVLMKKLQVPT